MHDWSFAGCKLQPEARSCTDGTAAAAAETKHHQWVQCHQHWARDEQVYSGSANVRQCPRSDEQQHGFIRLFQGRRVSKGHARFSSTASVFLAALMFVAQLGSWFQTIMAWVHV